MSVFLFSSSCPNFGNLFPIGGGGLEGTPLFSFLGADSSYPSGSWWLKFLLVWRFQGPELFWSTERQFPHPQPPSSTSWGPALGRGISCP